MFAVIGATGNVGSKLCETLLSRGAKVRAIARTPAKLQALAAKGADAKAGSVEDLRFLSEALKGAEAVFTMMPPNYIAADARNDYGKVGQSIARAVAEAKIPHVVNLSSSGAQHTTGTGIVLTLHDQEKRLNELSAHVTHLRPVYFMENLFMLLGTIKPMGIIGSPIKGDMKMPFVATADIAQVAADLMMTHSFTGKSVKDVAGPKSWTFSEIASLLGQAIGKPDLNYVQFPYEDAVKAMVGMGLSQSVASGLVEMQRAMNEGRFFDATDLRSTAPSPMPMEAFVQIVAGAYKAMG